MRTFVFLIGILLVVGGLTAVLSPGDFILPTSGPDSLNDVARDFTERVAKERAIATGYATIAIGIIACGIGFFLKNLKTPEPHDNPA